MANGQIAIIGTVGLPPRYGGFETLAAQLVRAAARQGKAHRLTVWCSARSYPSPRASSYLGANLRYLPLRANGAQSIPYDAWALAQAARSGHSTALLLGVSGAAALPVIRGLSRMRVITHLDGLESRRPKWGWLARSVLRQSEHLAVRWSHEIIADNPVIAAHIRHSYGRAPVEIGYGHEDHDTEADADEIASLGLPNRYALAVARAEPENNLALILASFAAHRGGLPLVAVSNWLDTPHGRALWAQYGKHPDLHLVKAEYDEARLGAIRQGASVYVHGHSAGGTNPILVNMMGAGLPVAAWDCAFNRATTENGAAYFDSADSLIHAMKQLCQPDHATRIAAAMRATALRRDRWEDVTAAYFQLLDL